MDLVASVRLMDQDQDNFVRRWPQLVQYTEQKILPLHGDRIVKRAGDRLMLAFASAPGGARAAFALLHRCTSTSKPMLTGAVPIAANACAHGRPSGQLCHRSCMGEDKITADVIFQLGTPMRPADILRAVHRPAPIKKETARATSG